MEEFYTVHQAAIVLKVHPLTIRRYVKEGKLKAYRVGGNIRIAVNDLRAFTQSFMPRQRVSRMQSATGGKAFSLADSLFRVKARGLSMSRLEQ